MKIVMRIGQLLPVDGYFVRLQEALPENFLQSLTHLYQPLIGPEALMLYQTLINEVPLQEESTPQTHHTLMNYLMLPLDQIYEARRKLEAIGLLRTYKKQDDGMTIYTYDLQSPYDPNSFFEDAMFSSLLYHYIGSQKFDRLKDFFTVEVQPEVGENITADFQEVFQTTETASLVQVAAGEEVMVEEDGTVDFEWLEHMLKQRMIPVHRILTKDNRKLITQMLVLYDLESFEIDKAIIWSLTEENHLDREEFKQACHDIYRAKNDNKPIRLIPKTETSINQQTDKKPLTREELLIQELETISPKQLLEDLSSGNFASEQDMKLISDVMTTQGLPAPVMNVLIHYVLLQTNMKLSRAYIEKIASHWSRAKLKTAKEAMNFAKQERANYEKAKARRKGGYQKVASKDIIPDWYKAGKHKEKPKESQSIDMNEEQRKVAQLLKQFSEGN
ncbi:replication initiation and membrane attachment family protein [Oceanobacillus luteolus]